MRPLISIQALSAILFALSVAACGFGDDRTHAADDGGDDAAECGDGEIATGEGCDDGDTTGGDGCDAGCEVEAGWNCTGEPSDCTMGQSECGDGAIANGEDCDDGGTAPGDGCDADCEIEAGWECHGSPSGCNLLCGNGHVDPGEDCDGGADCDADCHDITPVDCTLVPQSGCGADLACDLAPADDGSTVCRDAGNGLADSLCNMSDTQCAAGFTCVGVDDDTSICSKMCGTDAQCNGIGARCVVGLINGTTGEPIPGVEVCTNACDPLAQTGCPAGLGCLAYNQAGGDVTQCEDMGTRLDGQSCSDSTDCMAGSMCVGVTGGGSVCMEMCDVDGPDTCAGSATCLGFTTVILIGSREIGACD